MSLPLHNPALFIILCSFSWPVPSTSQLSHFRLFYHLHRFSLVFENSSSKVDFLAAVPGVTDRVGQSHR